MIHKIKAALKMLLSKSSQNDSEKSLNLDFLQSHLDRTSRSFAFCIKELNPQFRQVVSLCYLLCRILDTVEDYEYPSLEIKNRQFELFESFVLTLPQEQEVENWIKQFPQNVPEEYSLLVRDSYRLFLGLHTQLDPEILQICQLCILKMKQGMQLYASMWESNALKLSNLGEVNRYCYFVAGIVGELLRRLYCRLHSIQDSDAKFKISSIHFGLYLQKINFLKDRVTDESEGRYFIPDRTVLLSSLKENAVGAFQFLLKIPVMEKGFRLFCAWSLYIGLATIKLIESGNEQNKVVKLPRTQALLLIEKVKAIIDNNDELQALFDSYYQDLKHLPQQQAQRLQTPAWFLDAVGGILSHQEINELHF